MIGGALVPRLGWLKHYGGHKAVKDVIAGLILAILLVPQAMAYAQLAGLPPQTGLFAALVPPVLYMVFGTSNYVSMGPVALVSLIVADAVSGGDPAQTALIIAVEAGILLVVIGALGLGRLVNFVSEPALLGFTAAAAILIAFSQLPTLLGLNVERAGDLPTAFSALVGEIANIQTRTAVIGGVTVLVLLLLNRFAAPALWKMGLHPPYRQAVAKSLPLLVIVAAALFATGASGVETVEPVDAALPSVTVPTIDMALWISLLPSSAAVAIIVFVTATAVAKSLAGTDRSHLDTSREAVGLGMGNIAAAFTGGYAVGASLSRSALVEESGAASRVASVVGSLVVLAVLLFLAPLLVYLPKTALAALVISAVFGLIKLADIKNVWSHDRLEGVIIAVCFIATLMLGVRLGLAVGAGVSIMHFLWFSSLPRVTRIGTDDGGKSFRSVSRKDVKMLDEPVLVVRIDRSLFFANAAFAEEQIMERVSRHDDINCLVLDMRSVNAIDASGAAMLRRLCTRLNLQGINLHFAALHAPVEQSLQSIDTSIIGFHRTVGQAMDHCSVGQGDSEER
ncbi:SulP family inorganic anion transporter [Aurantiacibacter sediminis]|uniref:STAS domain-containing protein n=1 Tax=Aurantiacibacter sediminis TaxID=2793064 RepID=A0ABS0N5F6_9SPHN|nr:SulP family inorganic anion transporter [Aurantiacibacter sediminis]MBH5323008.1 STAS domain-containing protein [Aurantiacibacter sediminis]